MYIPAYFYLIPREVTMSTHHGTIWWVTTKDNTERTQIPHIQILLNGKIYTDYHTFPIYIEQTCHDMKLNVTLTKLVNLVHMYLYHVLVKLHDFTKDHKWAMIDLSPLPYYHCDQHPSILPYQKALEVTYDIKIPLQWSSPNDKKHNKYCHTLLYNMLNTTYSSHCWRQICNIWITI